PADVMTAALVEDVFGLACRIIDDPETGTPLMIPAAPKRFAPEDGEGRGRSSEAVMAEPR
ncbi:ABC transporter ATP-binding protein, partial [Streptomyces sp. NPDC127049]